MARSDDKCDPQTAEELLYQIIAEGGNQANEEIDHSQAYIYLNLDLNLAGDGIEEQPIAEGGNVGQPDAEGGNVEQQGEVQQVLYVNII